MAWVEHHYTYNFQVYTGKIFGHPEKRQGQRVVKDFVSLLYGSGRRITVDSFFTDLELTEELLRINSR
ncbi:hypothetical protein T4D_3242 [Trichinella pseudospiralis]|uniref:PiggyBac transposable element-derived protein domain-containing protein n=1 Tax=Trichinella pseudospiralis TaxID=6337 RepID=A0A0V1FKF8_TRIPS|nr:hypothetical protein T4D_3242 [Trichinella pseudospiralis]